MTNDNREVHANWGGLALSATEDKAPWLALNRNKVNIVYPFPQLADTPYFINKDAPVMLNQSASFM